MKNRILCSGWNKFVTEFADTESGVYKKAWKQRHTDDILATAVRYPQTLATASQNGELVLWLLETGQPYQIYNVMKPSNR